MYIKIEREINSDKWLRYPEAIDSRYLNKVINAAINCSKYNSLFDEVELSIIFTDNQEIREVNKKWRGKDKHTNVISIQVEDFSDIKNSSYIFLGNIILSVEKIEEEVQKANKSFINHYTHLVVHGTLHLMGYDHHAEDEAAEMESTEIMALKNFDISSPY